MSFSTAGSGQNSEINITPLIDVLLVLLIIFMVIAPTAQHGLDSELPQGAAGANTTAELPPVMLEVTGQDDAPRYRIDHRDVSADALPATLRAAFAIRQHRVAFVRGDRELTFQPVAALVATAKQAGATEVSLEPHAM